MKQVRIAFFTVDWNYELVESTLHGLKQFVDDHENVHLCLFDCFGKDVDNARNRSEYAIFDLPDLSQFDGVLIQGNQIVLGPVRDALARRVLDAGLPAVTIDCPIDGCTLISVDNYRSQYDIASHVLEKHGAKRLVYLSGLLDNGCTEGRNRLDGFLAACRDHGIPDSQVEVIECTWRTQDGYCTARRWMKEGRPLPDAFICANDEMALGLIDGLTESGISIPGDVRVTGYDNLPSAELSSPALSTVGRDYACMNYRAMETLLARINGEDVPAHVPFPYSLNYSESCGCSVSGTPGQIREKYFSQTRFLKNFYQLQDQMAEELFEAASLPELMNIVEKTHSIFGCRSIYVCINSFYYDHFDKKKWDQSSEAFDREMILCACGGRKHVPDDNHIYARFPVGRLLPADIMDRERFLVFYPLHYNTYSIGYLVMDSISEAAKLNLHESIFSFLEIAIENVRKKELLRQLNDVLDNLYVHDALTGLYNRFGYDRFAAQTFSRFMEESGGVQILFADMDDMKGINDQFGHEVGDQAICMAAKVLRACCRSGDFIMRYGGDEFLIIAPASEIGLAESFRTAAIRCSESEGAPYRLSLSVGSVVADRSDPRTLEECVQAADSEMYEIKSRRSHRKKTLPGI